MFFKYLTLLSPGLASAFTLITYGIDGWNKNEVTFYFNPANCSRPAEELDHAIEEALDAWNHVTAANMHLIYGGRTDATGTSENPIIECAASGMSGVLGVGSITTSDRDIVSGKLELNSEPGDSANIDTLDRGKVPIVIAHEVGHVMGLGHTKNEAALMYYSLSRKGQLTLSSDDAAGFSYLYPRHEPIDGVMGCGTISDSGGSGQNQLPWILALLMGTWVVRRWGQRSHKFALSPRG
jgi:hypothetical protein